MGILKHYEQQCITVITADSTNLRLTFDCAQGWLNPLGIAKVSAKPKLNAYKPVTDGYTRPISAILKTYVSFARIYN